MSKPKEISESPHQRPHADTSHKFDCEISVTREQAKKVATVGCYANFENTQKFQDASGTAEHQSHGDLLGSDIEFVCLSDLQKRGWTNSLIRKFLAEPDKLKLNPRYTSASPMKLYSMRRVLACEKDAIWLLANAKARVRGAAALRAASTRRDALLEQIDALEIRVEVIKASELLALAIQSYNDWNAGFDYFSLATIQSDDLFLQRIQVNYIRHHLTSYHTHLEGMAGKTGKQIAIRLIRAKVFAAIATSYPQFLAECDRQAINRAT